MSRRHNWPIAAAIGLYWLWGILLIAQKPGLQYDEALLVAGAVHMRNSAGAFDQLDTPNSWICPFDHCIPLMSAAYVGAVKEYAVLPFFAWFEPRASFIRIASLILSAFGIWGIWRAVAEFFSVRAAAVATVVIAINPAFVYMTVFDNNAVGAMMAGLGISCGCLAIYHKRKTFWTAFALGAAMGFAVWARANVAWVLIAGFAAALLVFRRQVAIPGVHWIAILLGGLLGGSPFLTFQFLSNGATWRAQETLSVSTAMATLLRQRVFWFADTLLSDGEHRSMWAGPQLPQWQVWLFPAVVVAACVVCLVGSPAMQTPRRLFARALATTFLIAGAFLFFSRMQVAEHHLIVLLPIAAVMAVVACSILEAALPWAWAISASVFLVYVGSAFYWQVAGIRGLGATGGVGVWSGSGTQLARYLDQNLRGREIKLLDWGLRYNMYVLTAGRLKYEDIYSGPAEELSAQGRPWIDEIRDGGIFLLTGPENRQFPKPSAGFLHVLASARPTMRTYSLAQRDGRSYAEVLEIAPNSIRGPAVQGEQAVDHLNMGDIRIDDRLTGFYPPETGGFRWTRREFAARLGFAGSTGAQLLVRLYIPDIVIQKLGSITLSARLGSHALKPETWSQSGQALYRRDLEADWITAGPVQVNFALNKSIPPTIQDKRELGIVVREISIELR